VVGDDVVGAGVELRACVVAVRLGVALLDVAGAVATGVVAVGVADDVMATAAELWTAASRVGAAVQATRAQQATAGPRSIAGRARITHRLPEVRVRLAQVRIFRGPGVGRTVERRAAHP
jgi:hypothetical protein